jgi:hypothetical protein
LFELKERKRLAMSTQMRRRGGGGVIWGEWRWNCWMEMEEKQNERERLREGQWWKPHVGWPYRIQSIINWEFKMRSKETVIDWSNDSGWSFIEQVSEKFKPQNRKKTS